MKKIFLTLIVLIGFKALAQNSLEQKINDVFIKSIENCQCKSGVLQVYSPSNKFDFSFSQSTEDVNKQNSKNTPFYTASITKMLTAASIGILKDFGKLSFQDKIHQYLPDTLLKGLHIYNNKDYSKDITIAHLLQHTSGLPDYFSDQTTDESPNVLDQVLMKPNKVWSPKELIEFSKDKMQPHFAPGEGFHYTDTGYVLLALIIENIGGLTLDEFFKVNLFEPFEMNNSYINLKSAPTHETNPLMPFYASEFDLSSLRSLSADWGGGGLVSTTDDLIKFLKAFNNDKIVNINTRLTMQSWVEESVGMDYGYGIRKTSFKELTGLNTDLEIIGHTGSTASFLWYNSQLDTYIAGSLNHLEATRNAMILVFDVLKIIENEK
jgi:CubicO group peptidase (beta-lactamase class C family)